MEDAWPGFQPATGGPRANLVADIVGHPKSAPSVAALTYMNPSLSEDAIRRHLDELRDAGVIEVLDAETDGRAQNRPDEFCALTREARNAFDRHGLFPEAAWTRQYARVEKTAEIRDLEAMPRPNQTV